MAYCSSCGSALPLNASYCAACGAAAPAAAVPAPPAYAPPPPPAPDMTPRRSVSEGMAIAALVLNVAVWPGLGSLVAGEKVGWAQGFLFLFGIPLALVLIGIPMLVGAWIWGIVTGVQLLQRASAAKAAEARVATAAPPAPPPPPAT